jgi:hypothetical protein
MRSRNRIHTHPRCARFNSETLARVCIRSRHTACANSVRLSNVDRTARLNIGTFPSPLARSGQCNASINVLKKANCRRVTKAMPGLHVSPLSSPDTRAGSRARGRRRRGQRENPRKKTGRQKWITTDQRRMIRTQCPHKPLKPPKVAKWLQAVWESQMYFSRRDHPYL